MKAIFSFLSFPVFVTALNLAAAPMFHDATETLELKGMGGGTAAWVDFNNDGWDDLHTGALWINEGGKKFTRFAGTAPGGSGTWADFNNDGLLDLFVCSYTDGRVRDLDSYIYWNREGRGFSASDRARLFTHSATGSVAADFNENGYVDLAVANHKVWGDQVAYSEVWWNGPDGFAESRTTRLPSSGPHGMSSVAPGNIADGGPEEHYTSAPHELPSGARVTAVSWQAEVPPKTWVGAQIRSSKTRDGLASSRWVGPDGSEIWFESGQALGASADDGPWVQYRLALGAINGGRTPRVTRVDVRYDR